MPVHMGDTENTATSYLSGGMERVRCDRGIVGPAESVLMPKR